MNFFSCLSLVPVNDSNWAVDLRRISHLEMNDVDTINDSGNGHDPVFKVGLQSQTLQSNFTAPLGIRADRKANLKSIDSVDADIIPVKSVTS